MTAAKIAIIAALERELHPLIEGWAKSPLECNGHTLWVYRLGEVVALAGGMGCRRAELATRRLIGAYRPQVLVSVGMAGALVRGLKVGSIATPDVVVDAATGAEYCCSANGGVGGVGVLVSAEEIAGHASKLELVERFDAFVVDMEAAGVARVAKETNVPFRCVKAISDELDFTMPPLNEFVGIQGNFLTGKFAAWAALRPQSWPGVIRLARNSSRATRALCKCLQKSMTGEAIQSPVVKLVPRLRGK